MSKSVLIINTPRSCCDCVACRADEREHLGEFTYRQLHKCLVKDHYLGYEEVMHVRPSWCPLRDIPGGNK